MWIVDFIFKKVKLFFKKRKRECLVFEKQTCIYIYGGKEEKNVCITFWRPRIMTHASRRKNENKHCETRSYF